MGYILKFEVQSYTSHNFFTRFPNIFAAGIVKNSSKSKHEKKFQRNLRIVFFLDDLVWTYSHDSGVL